VPGAVGDWCAKTSVRALVGNQRWREMLPKSKGNRTAYGLRAKGVCPGFQAADVHGPFAWRSAKWKSNLFSPPFPINLPCNCQTTVGKK